MNIPILGDSMAFPDIGEAICLRNGLVAVGGDLSVERLLKAYRLGIFPWYSDGQPICWWVLHPRAVLYPDKLHIGRSLAKTLRNKPYQVVVNNRFVDVMAECAHVYRPDQDGTWITDEMQVAYQKLHHQGYAHSFECYYPDEQGNWVLSGGLYGVQIGSVFYGESMFARRNDASKIAFVHAVRHLQACGVGLIDCQMRTDHTDRFGAESIDFYDFQAELEQLCKQPLRQNIDVGILHENLL